MQLCRNIDNDAEWDLFSKAARPVFEHREFILGPEVKMLEQKMAGWLQAQDAIGCNSGFGAQLLGILAFDRSESTNSGTGTRPIRLYRSITSQAIHAGSG